MREKYGLYCLWDVANNCFMARSPDFVLCCGQGSTREEAVTALDVDVQEWITTGRAIDLDVLEAFPAEQEQTPSKEAALVPSQEVSPKNPTPKKRSPLKLLLEALAASQEAALRGSLLHYAVTLNPCVISIRAEMTLDNVWSVRDEFLALALHHDQIIFDMRELSFIDSAGLALMVEMCKRLGGYPATLSVVASDPKDQIARVLRISHLDSLMHVFYSLEEALSFSQTETADENGKRD